MFVHEHASIICYVEQELLVVGILGGFLLFVVGETERCGKGSNGDDLVIVVVACDDNDLAVVNSEFDRCVQDIVHGETDRILGIEIR